MIRFQSRSLFRRLLMGFTAVVVGLWLCNLALDVFETRTAKKKDMQRELQATARRILVVMEMASDHPDQVGKEVRKMEQLHYASYVESGWYIPALQTQIWKGNTLIYASPDAGLPATLPEAGPQGQPSRDGWVEWIERDQESGLTVRMGTEVIGEWMLQVTSIGYYFEPLLFSLPLLLLPAWFIIRVGLQPLKTIVTEIEDRSATDLTPLADSPYQELSPLVSSVNRLMERLTERLEREQEFLLDAAHELKTPLSIIQINAESLNNPVSVQRQQEATAGLHEGVQRATHTVHQLLALARSGADRDNADLQQLDLVELVRGRLALLVQLASLRGIEFEFFSPEMCMLLLHRESMAALIDNLVGNAVKYAPPDSRIVLTVRADDAGVELAVIDQGPGIPEQLHKKVFERFYRQPGQDQPGSGLGLAIAERAALRNNGEIFLDNGIEGRGLKVSVWFSV